MQITTDSTVKEILDAYPDALAVFEKHGVDVPLECDVSVQDQALDVCETMCHIDDLDGLMRDLQAFVDSRSALPTTAGNSK